MNNSIKEFLDGKFNNLDDYEVILNYLEISYSEIENMWFENLNKIFELKLIILGESPGFGQDKKYIYNLEFKNQTAFLYFKDIEKICLTQKVIGEIKSKREMISYMNEFGILVLDIFPFALNGNDTKGISFKKHSNYFLSIFNNIFNFHLYNKFKIIFKKFGTHFNICCRYERNMSSMTYLMPLLNEMGWNKKIECIGGSNMPCDNQKLIKVYLS